MCHLLRDSSDGNICLLDEDDPLLKAEGLFSHCSPRT